MRVVCPSGMRAANVPVPRRMFLIDISYQTANVVANLSIGYVIQYLGYLWAFAISAVFFLIAFLYATCLLAETVRRPAQRTSFWSFAHVKRALLLYVRDDATRRRWKLQVTRLGAGNQAISPPPKKKNPRRTHP